MFYSHKQDTLPNENLYGINVDQSYIHGHEEHGSSPAVTAKTKKRKRKSGRLVYVRTEDMFQNLLYPPILDAIWI